MAEISPQPSATPNQNQPAAVGSIGSSPIPTDHIPVTLGTATTPPPRPREDRVESRAVKEAALLSTAQVAATALDGVNLVMGWDLLSAEERKEFERDLVPVLRRYNVGSLPYAEETQLIMTTGKIVLRRVMTKSRGEEGESDGGGSDWEEGERENRAPTQVDLSGARVAPDPLDFLARP